MYIQISTDTQPADQVCGLLTCVREGFMASYIYLSLTKSWEVFSRVRAKKLIFLSLSDVKAYGEKYEQISFTCAVYIVYRRTNEIKPKISKFFYIFVYIYICTYVFLSTL